MSSASLGRCRVLLAFVLWIVPVAAVADTVTLELGSEQRRHGIHR